MRNVQGEKRRRGGGGGGFTGARRDITAESNMQRGKEVEEDKEKGGDMMQPGERKG
jgi:hypothetical protein